MIIYSVTIALQASVESEWVDWMTKIHVPDVLRTGCFSECRMSKALGSEGEEPVYVMQYQCRSVEEYHRYRDDFAPALQKDHFIGLPESSVVLASCWKRSRGLNRLRAGSHGRFL